MRPEDQRSGIQRYTVIPRVLVFLTWNTQILLIRGAATKRLWAGKVNGLGGHVEPGETVAAAARREIREEAGLEISGLDLRAIVSITMPTPPGIQLFVFTGTALPAPLPPSPEGELFWVEQSEISGLPVMDDLLELLPRVLTPGPLHFGHYQLGDAGLIIRWETEAIPGGLAET